MRLTQVERALLMEQVERDAAREPELRAQMILVQGVQYQDAAMHNNLMDLDLHQWLSILV